MLRFQLISLQPHYRKKDSAQDHKKNFYKIMSDKKKDIECLIWWNNHDRSSSIWKDNDGFNVNLNDWKNTTLYLNASKLFAQLDSREIVIELEECARQSCLTWDFHKNELWNENYEHEQACNEPVVLYKSRMKRLDLNIIWSKILISCARERLKLL